jgi:ribosomal-protein-alanine N-acetyltransferase
VSTPDALHTERLTLRRWRDTDREPFAALNADPVVMERLTTTLGRSESDAMIESIEASFEERGFGLWAVEVLGGRPCIGFVGLDVPGFEAEFTPCVEVGWRLARDAWGYGYATEAARAAIADGFTRVELDEIVSFTTPGHTRSRAVMARLGMTHDPADDFGHPRLPEDHRLHRHVLYRLSADAWRTQQRKAGGASRT